MKHLSAIAVLVFCVALSPVCAADSGAQVATRTAGDQAEPQVARAASGAAVIVWSGPDQGANLSEIFARRYGANGEPVSEPFQVNQETRLRQYRPHVGMAADGSFIVAWLSEDNAPRLKVMARRFDAQGNPMGPEFQIDSGERSVITVALDVDMNNHGDAVIVYGTRKTIAGLASLDVRTIRGRRLSPDGELGREFRAALNPLPKLRAPAVAMAASGQFVIVWQADGGQPITTGIYARRYRANGRPYGLLPRRITQRDKRIAAYDTPKVAFAPNGSYSITWAAYQADTTPVSVFLRRFNANGAATGDMTQIDTGLTQPSIAVDGHGRLSLVAAGPDIVLRRFDADGDLVATRQITHRPLHTLAASIAVDGDGRSLVAWQDFGRDGDGRGVFAGHDVMSTAAAGQ